MKSKTQKTIETAERVGLSTNRIATVQKRTFRQREIIFGLVSMIVFASLVILTILVKLQPYYSVDLKVTLFLQQFRNTYFHELMFIVSVVGNGLAKYAVILIVAYFLYIRKKVKEAYMLLFSALGAELVSITLKTIVSRNRPDPLLINQVSQFDRADSFPSGHVLIYVGFFGFLLFIVYTLIPASHFRTYLIAILILILALIGPSRIYLGAHWLTDVTGAYLAGFLWVSLSVFIYNKWRLRDEKK